MIHPSLDGRVDVVRQGMLVAVAGVRAPGGRPRAPARITAPHVDGAAPA